MVLINVPVYPLVVYPLVESLVQFLLLQYPVDIAARLVWVDSPRLALEARRMCVL